MYSRYSLPYLSRQYLSSVSDSVHVQKILAMPSRRNTQEAVAILVPIYIMNRDRYSGCREKRYIPRVIGFSKGAVAKLTVPIVSIISPTRKIARPT